MIAKRILNSPVARYLKRRFEGESERIAREIAGGGYRTRSWQQSQEARLGMVLRGRAGPIAAGPVA